ncbi:MAG: GNAT family N-acetyltransferase [Chitinophagaceae bacterium]|nr:GNAT family N-acetyltransferase [Chitinophagaceae bacterium]
MDIRWECKRFDELTPTELYALMQLRNEVFVVEQNCVFQDADGKDKYGYHYLGWANEQLVAYTRLLPAGVSYEYASIGRVVTSIQVRSSGIGKILMKNSIAELFQIWDKQAIKIGAQLYLKKFYESFGFRQTSEVYMEDGIEHIEMVLPYI